MHPTDRRYTPDHMWIRLEGRQGVIGVTDYFRQHMCPLESVQLPAIDRSYARGEALGAVESAKTAVEIHAPASGRIVAVNEQVTSHPASLCEDPYDTWIARIQLARAAELSTLLSSVQYAESIAASAEPKKSPRPPAKKAAAPRANPPSPSAPRPVVPPKPSAPQAPVRIDPDALLVLSWRARLRNTVLKAGDDAFGDRDYSGGGYLSWRERTIVLGDDHRFAWRDTRFTRVSSGGLSQMTESHQDSEGTWKMEIVSGSPSLLFLDTAGSRQAFRVEEARPGGLLLEGKPYSWTRRR